MNRDIAGGIALAVFAALYIWGAGQIQHSSLSDGVGARGIPLVLGILLVVIAAAIIGRAWLAGARGIAVGNEDDNGRLPRVLGLLACGVLYMVAGWLAGYVIAVFITMTAISVYEGAPWGVRTLAVAASGAVAFWLIFVKLLAVAQPAGLLFGG